MTLLGRRVHTYVRRYIIFKMFVDNTHTQLFVCIALVFVVW